MKTSEYLDMDIGEKGDVNMNKRKIVYTDYLIPLFKSENKMKYEITLIMRVCIVFAGGRQE
jgi:hypothetical protein